MGLLVLLSLFPVSFWEGRWLVYSRTAIDANASKARLNPRASDSKSKTLSMKTITSPHLTWLTLCYLQGTILRGARPLIPHWGNPESSSLTPKHNRDVKVCLGTGPELFKMSFHLLHFFIASASFFKTLSHQTKTSDHHQLSYLILEFLFPYSATDNEQLDALNVLIILLQTPIKFLPTWQGLLERENYSEALPYSPHQDRRVNISRNQCLVTFIKNNLLAYW